MNNKKKEITTFDLRKDTEKVVEKKGGEIGDTGFFIGDMGADFDFYLNGEKYHLEITKGDA
jgi:hypothetical protein